MKIFILVVLAIIMIVAIRFGVLGVSGLETRRQDEPLAFWAAFAALALAFCSVLASLLGLF
jgi:hypothetical protein